jgi:MFS family permease
MVPLDTLGNAFIQNYTQAMICRVLLGAAEAGISPGFAYMFATIYPPGSTAKRIMLGNLANTTSGAFGGLFAYGIQSMGDRQGLRAWISLFIIESIISFVVGGLAWICLSTSPETARFLNAEQRDTMTLRKQRDAVYRGEDEFEKKWIKYTFSDPLVWLAGGGFFFSSVAITDFNVLLPTIIKGLGYAIPINM